MPRGGRVTDQEIYAAADAHGVPRKLFKALIMIESGGRRNAVSPAGARGPAQIMPTTGPPTMDFGAKYLAQQKKAFGTWTKALAAYNAGPGRVQDGSWRSIAETRKYVKMVLGRAGAFNQVPVAQAPTSARTSVTPVSRPGSVPMPMPEPSMAGLAHLAQGDYDPTERLEELLQQRLAAPKQLPAGAAPGGAPRQPRTRVSGAALPAGGDFKWQDWVRVPKATGSTSKPSGPEILSFVGKIGQMRGKPLPILDNTHHSRTTVNGNESAHYSGRAADIPATGAELRRLGYLALRAAGMDEKQARKAQKTGGLFNVGGYQVIFATRIGGNHWNHVHVGLHG